ncbi:hypothetical protein B0T18DRAFT_388952 [Schizothecium vesticola]|uniref:Uncharacterized protein n=1 Tax=Schizothecium vesticola TaxID=314040 RepID=A0AA40K7Y6_9PEZI|nr:hypothetical protein B0T18DRAFT_388952 [Schizothecium vesticola]
MTDAILRRRAKRVWEYFPDHTPQVRPVEIIFEVLSNTLCVVLEDDVDIESLQDELPMMAEDLHGHELLISCDLRDSKRIWKDSDESLYIGEVLSNIPGTSLVLIEIDQREGDKLECLPLTNQAFEVMSGVVPQLKRHRSSGDRLEHKVGYLNSPFTGNMEVTVVGHSVQFQQLDDEKTQLVVCDWLCTGQVEGNAHKITPPGGTTGSAIWDHEGLVLGFWDCYIPIGPFAGMANAVSASELSDKGIHLMTCCWDGGVIWATWGD